MLNKYQRDADEFRRIVKIIKAGMSWIEVQRFLSFDILHFARALNIRTINNRRTVAHTIWRTLRDNDFTEPYIDPKDLPKPKLPDASKNIPCCDAEEKLPETLRWGKVEKGQSVTYSVDEKNNPDPLKAFSSSEIDSWFAAWSDVCGITFKRVTGKGDIHIQYAPIDGPGKTLGFAYQPRAGVEFMESSSDLSGDITIDSTEGYWPVWKSRSTGKHEVGHAIGLDHIDNIAALLYPSIVWGADRGPQAIDIVAAQAKYPLKQESIPA